MLLLALTLSTATAFYTGTNVVELTAKNFDQVYADTNTWMIEFYAPWCGHCQRLTPEYTKAAASTKGLAKFGAINCDEQSNQPVCGPFGIQGFPTLKVLPWNAKRPSDAMDYQGARSSGAMAKFLVGQIPNSVSLLSKDKHRAAFDEQSELSKVILFSDKKSVSSLYRSLAQQFKNRLAFAQTSLDDDLADSLGATSSPTLVVVPADGSDPVTYDGALKPVPLGKFLSKHAPALEMPKDAAPPPPPPPKTPPQDALWRIASSTDYAHYCQDRPGTCVIAMLDPLGDGFAEYKKAMEDVLEEHKGAGFTITWTDAYTQDGFVKEIGMRGQDLPQLVVINDGKGAWNRFVGAFDAVRIGKYLKKLKLGTQSVQKLREGADIAGSWKQEETGKDEL